MRDVDGPWYRVSSPGPCVRMRLIDAWGGDNRNAEETGRQCMPNGGYDLDAWDQAP